MNIYLKIMECCPKNCGINSYDFWYNVLKINIFTALVNLNVDYR